MDLSSVIRFYIEKMLRDVTGMKAMLLDADTTRIVSTVYSQSEILEQEVYLVERLDADPGEQLLHLKVSCHILHHFHCESCGTSCHQASLPSFPRKGGGPSVLLVADVFKRSLILFVGLAGSMLLETHQGKCGAHQEGAALAAIRGIPPL